MIYELRLSMSIIAALSRRVRLNLAGAGIKPSAPLFDPGQPPIFFMSSRNKPGIAMMS
ncbi:MAG: hypothetical protein HY848_08025 [Betaproteobacteria bacterium]|nr:hypothetical protein [Betaproteobacteria bacterium]